MRSVELKSSLQHYAIGSKIRKLRRNRNLALEQLGRLAGLSQSLLSKIERDLQVPPILTLMRIAAALEVDLDHFFARPAPSSKIFIVRKGERIRLPERPDKKSPSYFFENLVFPVNRPKIEAYYAEFEDRTEPVETHAHSGAEMIYVVTGQLIVKIRGEELRLEKGDTAYFDLSNTHSYRRRGRCPCSAIIVVAR